MKFLRAFAEKASDNPEEPIRFVASTEGKKSDGYDLKSEDWSLARFLAHPVILYVHDYEGKYLPIGTGVPTSEGRKLNMDVTFDVDDPFAMRVRAKTVKGMMAASVGWEEIEEDGKKKNSLMEMSVVPVPLDSEALPVRMRAFIDQSVKERRAGMTVGTMMETALDMTFTMGVNDLFRSDVVTRDERTAMRKTFDECMTTMVAGMGELAGKEIGENYYGFRGERKAIPPKTMPMADMDMMWDGPAEMAKAEGREQLYMMCAWVDGESDPELKSSYKLPHHTVDGKVVWKGVAAAMARLLQANTQIPEADREGVYKHLARHYEQFDKTTPEFRTIAELDAMTRDVYQGQFLEHELDNVEPQERVGKMLSARNLDDLNQAMELIQGVIDRAKSEPEEDDSMRSILEALTKIVK